MFIKVLGGAQDIEVDVDAINEYLSIHQGQLHSVQHVVSDFKLIMAVSVYSQKYQLSFDISTVIEDADFKAIIHNVCEHSNGVNNAINQFLH